jgi:uncharacterized protein
MADLAQRIAVFHRDAPVSLNHGGADGIAGVLSINEQSLRDTRLVPDDLESAFSEKFRQTLRRRSEVLERRLSGKVRRCHGDLILRDIRLWHGTPTLFDCIEFNEDLATIDVLYDLAFALMDLWHRDQQPLANTLLIRYPDEADEADGLELAPFFVAIRATVRAHVTAAPAQNTSPMRCPACCPRHCSTSIWPMSLSELIQVRAPKSCFHCWRSIRQTLKSSCAQSKALKATLWRAAVKAKAACR